MRTILLWVVIFLLSVVSANAEKIRVIYKPDNSIITIIPAPNSKLPDETEEQWLERVFNKAQDTPELNGLPYDDIDRSGLPAGDGLGWKGKKGKGVWVDNAKVEKIKQEKLISKKAVEIKDKELKKKAIEQLKQEKRLPEDYPIP